MYASLAYQCSSLDGRLGLIFELQKRLSLGGVTHSIFVSGLPPPPLGVRQVSEDWVSRTRGLSIDKDTANPIAIKDELRAESSSSRRDGDSEEMVSGARLCGPLVSMVSCPTYSSVILTYPEYG